MTPLDMTFALLSMAAIAVLLISSPWHRAVVGECLAHPRSRGWVEMDRGRVVIHRGSSLGDLRIEKSSDDVPWIEAIPVPTREVPTRLKPAARAEGDAPFDASPPTKAPVTQARPSPGGVDD